MQLVSSISAGVSGAQNGSAKLFRRGTATRATYYLDFDGLVSVQTGADVTLDANGGATIYVDSIVDVQVYTSSGVLVRAFTEGGMATVVQYKGPSFTGIDPVSAAHATNQPVAVKTVLDLILASFGTKDFLVDFNGTDRNLFEVLAGLVTFVSVQDPLYAAAGDGATDDTAAIAAAIDAASAAGGGIVWFPAGVYAISALIEVPNGVSLLGPNSVASAIKNTGSTAGWLSYTGVVDDFQRAAFIRGLSFTGTVSNLHTVLLTSGADLLVEQCEFGDGDKVAGTLATSGGAANGEITFRDCAFYTSNSAVALSFPTAGKDVVVSGCRFKLASGQGVVALTDLALGRVHSCRFDCSATTTGTFSTIKTRGCIISDCLFTDSAGATVTFIEYVSGELFESNNDFGDGANSVGYKLGTTNAQLENMVLLSRELRWVNITDNGDPVTLPADQYGSVTLLTNGSADVARTYLLTPGPIGATLKLFFLNESGVNIGIVVGTTAREAAGGYTAFSGTVNNQKKQGLMLTSVPRNVGTGIPFGVVWAALGDNLTP
jgi:hypothetical protein